MDRVLVALGHLGSREICTRLVHDRLNLKPSGFGRTSSSDGKLAHLSNCISAHLVRVTETRNSGVWRRFLSQPRFQSTAESPISSSFASRCERMSTPPWVSLSALILRQGTTTPLLSCKTFLFKFAILDVGYPDDHSVLNMFFQKKSAN